MGSIAAAIAIMIAVAAFATGGLGTPPQPDVLAQPEVMDIPRPTEEPMVWCTEKGNYYHFDEHCSGMEGAIYGTLTYALALDKDPCPMCIAVNEEVLLPTAAPAPEEYTKETESFSNPHAYISNVGLYYHTQEKCSGVSDLQEIDHEALFALNKISCPVCYLGLETVYATEKDNYYHCLEDCSGMTDTQAMLAADAYSKMGKQACPVCLVPLVYQIETVGTSLPQEHMHRFKPYPQLDLYLSNRVYSKLDDPYFHKDTSCTNLSETDQIKLEQAVGRKQEPCPKCFPIVASINPTWLLDDLYQSAFGNLDEALALAYGFMPAEDAVHYGLNFSAEEYENTWVLTNGHTHMLTISVQENTNDSKFKYIMNAQFNGTAEEIKLFMKSIVSQPLVKLYPEAMLLSKEHLARIHGKGTEDFIPYVSLLMIGFDENYSLLTIQLDFRNGDDVFGIEFTRNYASSTNWKHRIIT